MLGSVRAVCFMGMPVKPCCAARLTDCPQGEMAVVKGRPTTGFVLVSVGMPER